MRSASRTSARRRCCGIARQGSRLPMRSCGRIGARQRCAMSFDEYEPLFSERTGLKLDPYFSATKIRWLLDRHRSGDLVFGTVDTWLIWQLTQGRVHVTD